MAWLYPSYCQSKLLLVFQLGNILSYVGAAGVSIGEHILVCQAVRAPLIEYQSTCDLVPVRGYLFNQSTFIHGI